MIDPARYPILSRLVRDIARLYLDATRPDAPGCILIREEGENMLVYKVTPAVAKSPDVVKQSVTFEVDGVQTVLEFPGSDGLFKVEQGKSVKVFQVDTDDADLSSAPSAVVEFVATDTIPPLAPDAPSVVPFGEE